MRSISLHSALGHGGHLERGGGDPNLAEQGVRQFEKRRNGEVARAMEWSDIENTDIGTYLEGFLKNPTGGSRKSSKYEVLRVHFGGRPVDLPPIVREMSSLSRRTTPSPRFLVRRGDS
jgi:hypothetical protein